jgi:hypothetical protein
MVREGQISETIDLGPYADRVRDEDRQPWSTWWLVAAATVASLLEIGAYLLGGWCAWLAARLWVACSAAFVLGSVLMVGRVLVGDVRRFRGTPVVLIAVAAWVTFGSIGGVDHLIVNHEASQEVAAGLDALASADLEYTGTGFLGYPVRQYILAAAPAFVLGRSLTALRLGYGLLFFLGILVCWGGLRNGLEGNAQASAIAALTVLSFFSFPYLPEFVRLYEQNTIPFSLTALATGWLLLADEKPKPLRLAALAWVGCMLGTSYTPSLAVLGLLAVVIFGKIASALRDRHFATAVAWAMVLLPPLVFTAMAATVRKDLRFHHVGGADFAGAWSALREAFSVAFLGEPRLFMSPLLLLPICVYLLVALFFGAGLRHAVTAWWVLATLAAAVVLQGYTTPPPEFALHRALVVIPPLMVGMLAWLLKVGGAWRPWIPRPVLTGVAVVLTAAAWVNVRAAERHYQPGLRDMVVADLARQVEGLDLGKEPRPTFVALTTRSDLDNIGDYLRYFLPGTEIVREPRELSSEKGPLLIYADQGRWPNALRSAGIQPQREIRFDNPYTGHIFEAATVPSPLGLGSARDSH